MRAWLLPLAAGLALAACAPRSQIGVHPGMDIGRYRRFGILPLTDPAGRGEKIADLVARGLVAGGVDAVDGRQLEAVFKSLKLDRSQSGLDMHSVAEIRRLTFAEALVFGALDSRGQEASVIVIETELGEPVLNARLKAKNGRFQSAEEIAAAVLTIFSYRPTTQSILPDL